MYIHEYIVALKLTLVISMFEYHVTSLVDPLICSYLALYIT
jgi:hypothetical protein